MQAYNKYSEKYTQNTGISPEQNISWTEYLSELNEAHLQILNHVPVCKQPELPSSLGMAALGRAC